MVDRKVVPFDEFYYQLKLMYLFLLHLYIIIFPMLYRAIINDCSIAVGVGDIV
jgi:hypothetical protein